MHSPEVRQKFIETPRRRPTASARLLPCWALMQSFWGLFGAVHQTSDMTLHWGLFRVVGDHWAHAHERRLYDTHLYDFSTHGCGSFGAGGPAPSWHGRFVRLDRSGLVLVYPPGLGGRGSSGRE